MNKESTVEALIDSLVDNEFLDVDNDIHDPNYNVPSN